MTGSDPAPRAGRVPVVLHITYALDFGGVETHLGLIAETPGKRFAHQYCALGHGGAAGEAIRAAGAAVHILDIDGHRTPLRCLAKLVRLIRAVAPEVVHCHGAEGNLYGLVAAWIARVPVRIGEEIGIPDHSPAARRAMTFAYRFADRVIGVSDAVRDWLVASGEVPAHKALRVYNPVRLPHGEARPRDPGARLRIGFVGRLEPVKNPLALVDAVAELIGGGLDCELVLIGDGGERGTIERKVRDAALADRIHVCGFVAAPAVSLATCHLYVQPSLSEGFGIALVEAMAVALPVIASRVGGMPEIVVQGRTGWLLAATDASAIAAAIAAASALDPQALAAIGAAARESVGERFDPAQYCTTIEQLYDAVRSPARVVGGGR